MGWVGLGWGVVWSAYLATKKHSQLPIQFMRERDGERWRELVQTNKILHI